MGVSRTKKKNHERFVKHEFYAICSVHSATEWKLFENRTQLAAFATIFVYFTRPRFSTRWETLNVFSVKCNRRVLEPNEIWIFIDDVARVMIYLGMRKSRPRPFFALLDVQRSLAVCAQESRQRAPVVPCPIEYKVAVAQQFDSPSVFDIVELKVFWNT